MGGTGGLIQSNPYYSSNNLSGMRRASQGAGDISHFENSYSANRGSSDYTEGTASGMQRNHGAGQSGPYAGGMPTEFNSFFGLRPGQIYDNYSASADPDVREAQRLTNENKSAEMGINVGVDALSNQARIDALKSRIGLKNSLAERISGAGDELRGEKDSITDSANTALSQGTKNTRQNYNRRGLLYSGMREGGEGAVRSAVAGQMASGLAGAERDVSNEVQGAKNAYSAVGLAQQEEQLKMANSAFDTAHANNIARLQAMQQLGQGVGYAGGTIAGAYGSRPPPNTGDPTSGWNPQGLQQPSWFYGNSPQQYSQPVQGAQYHL